ncbi:MAG: GTP-binding protein [Rubrivivax sp.]|nr:GTP-binding protein [Rubrivivax sp.]MCL4699311.1 GTP-binding protein [Burkholderiaceae bacterium]
MKLHPEYRPVPVTILTGFLGSGKTTLLNHILTERHGHRIAVIENEFGEIDVDSDLVLSSEEEIYQMTNGCICCVADVREDLVQVLGKLLARRERFDHILVETSGLADPTPVAATFFIDNDVARQVRLDAVVTLVDARHALAHLDDPLLDGAANQAVEQVVTADRIVINKTDLASEDELRAVEARVRRINETAEMLRSSYAKVDVSRILGIGGFMPPPMVLADAQFHDCDDTCAHDGAHGGAHDGTHDGALPAPGHAGHAHDPSVGSVSRVFDGAFDRERLLAWLDRLAGERAEQLFRLKGVVAIAGDERRHVLQGVHRVIDLQPADPWGERAASSKLVFIGRELDAAAIDDGLRACLARPG